jgi:hypothetical protein
MPSVPQKLSITELSRAFTFSTHTNLNMVLMQQFLITGAGIFAASVRHTEDCFPFPIGVRYKVERHWKSRALSAEVADPFSIRGNRSLIIHWGM